jgi:hypothetical protein
MLSLLANKIFGCIKLTINIVNRELKSLRLMIHLIIKFINFIKRNHITAEIFLKHVRKHPNKPCIIFNKQIWTFQEVCFHFCFIF